MKSLPKLFTTISLATACLGTPALAKDRENATMEGHCRREVIELHRFFQDWFTGELPENAESFDRFDGVLAADFEIIGPEGRRVERGALVPGLRGRHGQHAAGVFTIEVRNVRSRTVGEGMVLITYEEHQTTGEDARSWLSSALFRTREGGPNGVEWVHVQETYLPGSARDD